jgi:hypothetical protein
MNLQQAKVKHEFFAVAQAAGGLAVLGLMFVGICGTIYKAIAPNGWLVQAFGRSISAGAAALGSLLIIVALAWFSHGWNSARSRNRYSNLLIIGFAMAGVLYLSQITKGSF